MEAAHDVAMEALSDEKQAHESAVAKANGREVELTRRAEKAEAALEAAQSKAERAEAAAKSMEAAADVAMEEVRDLQAREAVLNTKLAKAEAARDD